VPHADVIVTRVLPPWSVGLSRPLLTVLLIVLLTLLVRHRRPPLVIAD